ncbi:PREDICTED: cationic amino acid transporter 4 [Bison bison bison]|uniref:Cationic amino acid transporter 4 n=1 Tax=Bison bison bison TaxID=43346 RepID=A0A6P3H1R3_BISBB|nr:PREDICTED: cationic amino acid transporter 4 [Bison bison bison]
MAPGRPCAAGLARFCQKLKRRKLLEDSSMATSLQRCLSALDLTLLGVGSMVGSGLYVLTGVVAKEVTGPAVTVSFVVAAVASLMAALCYAEFGARVPRTGSAYLFTYVSMGELWAFLIGWNLVLEYVIASAAVARAWSGYLDAMFDHRIQNFTEAHLGVWQVPFLARSPDWLAAGIILLASAFVSCGARVSSWLNHTLSAVSMIVILFIVVLGFILARPSNWGEAEGGFAPFGFSGVMSGTATCFYAFVGFDIIAASSEEARDPKRAVPLAIALSLGLAATAYILVSAVLTLMIPWHSLNPNSALADAFYQRGYSWAGYLVATGSICAMTTVQLSGLFCLPRIIYAMAADGLFFEMFAYVHPRTQVPLLGILAFGALTAVVTLLLDLDALVQFLSIGTLLAYTFVAISVLVLRFQTASQSRSPSLAGSGPKAKEYSSFSDHLELVGAGVVWTHTQAHTPRPGPEGPPAHSDTALRIKRQLEPSLSPALALYSRPASLPWPRPAGLVAGPHEKEPQASHTSTPKTLP